MGENLTGANLTEESHLISKLARKDMSWKPETKSDVKRSFIKKREGLALCLARRSLD